MADDVFHTDTPDAQTVVRRADGTVRVISNLSGAEYAETYAEGTPCSPIPPDVLAATYAKLGYVPSAD